MKRLLPKSMKFQQAFGGDLGRKRVPKRVLGDPQRATKKEMKKRRLKSLKKGHAGVCRVTRGSARFCSRSGLGVVVSFNLAELTPAGATLNLMNTPLRPEARWRIIIIIIII